MSDPTRATGPASAPDTVTEALSQLVSEGYTADYQLRDGVLYPSPAGDGGGQCRVGDAVVERVYRFEGPSDPGDEMVVFGIRNPITDVRGTLVSAFGPAADPDVLDQLTYLASHVDADRRQTK
jgi:hypothetical protein